MDVHPGPAEGFVRRLLANPALESLPPLHKEEQILQFLEANAQALYPTLSAPEFLPGRRWAEILTVLTRALTEATDAALKPWLERWTERELDLDPLAAVGAQSVPEQAVRRELREISHKLLDKPESRRALAGPLAAVQIALPDRYLEASFRQHQYIHFELTKVQRLRLEPSGMRTLLALTLLLRPLIHLFTSGPNVSGREVTSGLVSAQFASNVLGTLRSQFRALPLNLLRSAVTSNCSFLDDRRIEATARLAAIFASRGRSYSPVQVDRGANGPDSSWFSVARRNYKYYGFDIKMLDELYRIAADNGW
jgi:hypothetical protein